MDLAARRRELKMTQDQLCALLGISRQTLSAIERGTEQPKVGLALRISDALGTSVEDLFAAAPHAKGLALADMPGGVGIYGEIGETVVVRAMPSTPADGLWQVPNGRIDATSHLTRLGDPSVLIDGCDPILGLLIGYLSRRVGGVFHWWSMPNSQALANLSSGRAHLCLLHGPIDEPLELAEGIASAVVPLVRWDLCIATKPGNPRKIFQVEDLFRPDVAFAPRVRGSGVRQLSERFAARAGRSLDDEVSFDSHLSACYAVRFGSYDATLTMAPVAAAVGLEWTAIGEQQSWLVASALAGAMPRVRDALSEIAMRSTAKMLSAIPNYRRAG